MRKFGLLLLVCVMGFSLAGCSKKSEPLEEMQQPMSPDDLNRIKNATTTSEQGATMPVASQTEQSVTDVSLEPLPPSGPYKPSAKEIQAALKNAGYYTGTVDGKIGPMTKRAIEEFQRANNLQADGKVGPKTWAALSAYLTSAAASVQETSGLQQ
ncbi:MAG TPA: peptidoglycan-binding domain-containing protein [Candidatus Omnitrophota bacterium]|nr:peptidoglycan-binding domain-containing protein [Candidatus Omnitrophota bacterium]